MSRSEEDHPRVGVSDPESDLSRVDVVARASHSAVGTAGDNFHIVRPSRGPVPDDGANGVAIHQELDVLASRVAIVPASNLEPDHNLTFTGRDDHGKHEGKHC